MLASLQRPEKNCARPSDGYSEIRGSDFANCLAAGSRKSDGNQRLETLIMTTNKTELNAAKPNCEATTQEETAIRDNYVRKTGQPTPRIKILNNGKTTTIAPDHPNKAEGHLLLKEALGTADDDFFYGLIEQLANAGSQNGEIAERKLNFIFSIIKGIKPTDQVEAMLAAQMAATHNATMRFAQQLMLVDNIPQQDCAERTYNKLARTFASQMEALKRYRTGGEQKVTVSVSEGGQAIVGNVTHATHQTEPEHPASATPALTDRRQPAMTVLTNNERAPVASPRRQKDDR
jgi:hypothetical protein